VIWSEWHWVESVSDVYMCFVWFNFFVPC
jgi:hypothetical protein